MTTYRVTVEYPDGRITQTSPIPYRPVAEYTAEQWRRHAPDATVEVVSVPAAPDETDEERARRQDQQMRRVWGPLYYDGSEPYGELVPD